MAKSISDFVSHVSDNRLASPNRYWVEFGGVGSGVFGDMAMYCKTATMPGRSFQTVSQRQFGIPYKIPYTASYDDVSFTFTLSEDLKERRFFEAWQAKMYNQNNSTMNYYRDYVGNCTIQQLNKQMKVTYSVFLYDAFPVALSSVDYAYDNTDSLQQMTVTMAYRYWTNQQD